MGRHPNRHVTFNQRRAAESAVPDGEEIRRLRIEKGWTQAKLIEVVQLLEETNHHGLEERTLRKAEQGDQRCQLRTLRLIAQVLGCSVEQIIRGQGNMRWAMMDEVLESSKAGMSRAGDGVLARLLYALERAADGRVVEMELLLTLAVRRDVMGDPRGAYRIGLLLVNEVTDANTELFIRIRARVAAFCDHVGRQEKGLVLLEPIIRHLKPKGPWSNEEWWAVYQQGTLLARVGNTTKARRILQRIRNSAPLDALRSAALHQMAVIDLEQFKLDAAEAKFQTCLAERLARSKDDFRVVYEYRRLSEVYETRGNTIAAKRYLRNADRVLSRWSFERYAKELSTSR